MPYHECPSFDACSCNKCPLDPDIYTRISEPNDEKCKAHKPTRHKIGLKYPELLPYKGFTKREFNGRKRWNELAPEKKELIAAAGSQRLKFSRMAIKNG